MKKFGIIGTSCSGKTTAVYNIVGNLRRNGIHIEGVVSTDRIYPFEKDRLDYLDSAQCYVILQQGLLETIRETRSDLNCFLTDRTPLDFLAYYDYFIKNKNEYKFESMNNFVYSWMKTYDLLFYLPPLPWVDDSKRPPDQIRNSIDQIILQYITKLNVLKIDKDLNPDDRILAITNHIINNISNA